MTNRNRQLCALLCATLCLAALAPAEAESKGICYRVTGGRNELFLLGSIHIGRESMYPMSDEILDALEAADTLVLECDTSGAAVVAQTRAMMAYPSGDSLQNHVSAETYALLEQVCVQTGYSLAMLNALRPWAVVSMLSVQSTAAEMGVEDVTQAIALGVEAQVCALAGDKPRAYLETAVEQLTVLDGFSPQLQDYMLLGVLRTIQDPQKYAQVGDADITQWPTWWENGDANSFAQSYLKSLQADPEQELAREYHTGLVTKRNRTMAQGLRGMLEGNEKHSYFAVVGLLHLALPDDSVVGLLKDMGYGVERVE